MSKCCHQCEQFECVRACMFLGRLIGCSDITKYTIGYYIDLTPGINISIIVSKCRAINRNHTFGTQLANLARSELLLCGNWLNHTIRQYITEYAVRMAVNAVVCINGRTDNILERVQMPIVDDLLWSSWHYLCDWDEYRAVEINMLWLLWIVTGIKYMQLIDQYVQQSGEPNILLNVCEYRVEGNCRSLYSGNFAVIRIIKN